MNASLLSATLWSFLHRFGALGISFVSNMVLARLLCPEDFGLVAFIMIFVGIADVLVDGGLGNALIQRKVISENDVKTVFSLNILFSIVFTTIVIVSAPFISNFASIENLSFCLRIQSVTILIKSLYAVPFSILNRKMEFKKIAIIGLVANSLATILAIILAVFGLSYWSLILRNILLDIISLICYYKCCEFRPSLGLNKKSFSTLLGYGSYVAIANIMEYLYSNIISFIIGKKYSVKELGYYNQAYSLQQIPVFSLSAIINQVFLPYFSMIQDDKDAIVDNIKKTIIVVSFFIYPILTYLIIFAKPVIVLLYSEKWLPSVPLFKIVCIAGFFNALLHLSRSVLKAIDKTKELFLMQIFTILAGLLLLAYFMQFEMTNFVYVVAINGLLSYLLVGILVGHYLRFNIIRQILSLLPNLSISVSTGFIVWYCFNQYAITNTIIQIVLSFALFCMIYILFHYIFRTQGYRLMVMALKNKNKY